MPDSHKRCRWISPKKATTRKRRFISTPAPASPAHEQLTRTTPPLSPRPSSIGYSAHSVRPVVYSEPLYGRNLITEAARQWANAPHERDQREAHYMEWLLGNIRGNGFRFLRNYTLEVTKQTLEPLMRMITPDLNVTKDPNIILARLLVLYNRAGLFVRNTNSVSPRDSKEAWQPFPYHPACMLAHGKRVILTGTNIAKIIQWLCEGHTPIKRYSSHNIKYHHNGQDWQETKSMANAIGKNDYGINLALFGLNNHYPFLCVNKTSSSTYSYEHSTVRPGQFGHLLLGPVDTHRFGQATFLGIENNGPGLCSPQGYGHGIKCKENNLSAFWLPKWGDQKMIDALTYYAETQDVPNEAEAMPGKNYGKIKTNIDFVTTMKIVGLSNAAVLEECRQILTNPLHLSPVRRINNSELNSIPTEMETDTISENITVNRILSESSGLGSSIAWSSIPRSPISPSSHSGSSSLGSSIFESPMPQSPMSCSSMSEASGRGSPCSQNWTQEGFPQVAAPSTSSARSVSDWLAQVARETDAKY